MAVDYLHRLLVEGPPADVGQLRADMWSEYPREVGGQRWTEVVPFSFERLYALAPAARRVATAFRCERLSPVNDTPTSQGSRNLSFGLASIGPTAPVLTVECVDVRRDRFEIVRGAQSSGSGSRPAGFI